MRWNATLLLLSTTIPAAACGVRPQESAPPLGPPALELRLADTAPRPGWISIELSALETPLFLDPGMVVGTRDLAAVAAEPTPEGLRLDLHLTDAGAERLARVTAENVGRWLAVVADGQVLSAARIAQGAGGGGVPVHVQLRMDSVAADRLRRRIEAAWPAAPGAS